MRKSLSIISLSCLLLTACQQSVVTTIDPVHAQSTESSNSIIGEACDGHDHFQGVKLSGNTRFVLTADIRDVSSGQPAPMMTLKAPIYEGISRLPAISYVPNHCQGGALKTEAYYEDGKLYVDYVVEVQPSGVNKPSIINNRILVNQDTGLGRDSYGFKIQNASYAINLSVAPGPLWDVEQNEKKIQQDEKDFENAGFAKPLPDERPGRTLQDVMQK